MVSPITDRILERVDEHASVRHALPHGGVLSLDRSLPYLIVYREPPRREDVGTERLVATESAYLIARRGEDSEVGSLVRRLAQAGSAAHGAFLVLELWSSPDPASRRFVVRAPRGPAPETVGKMVDALQPLGDLRPGVEVVLETGDERHPPGLPQLLSIEESWQTEVLLLGLEVPPIFRDGGTGAVYPLFLRQVQHHLSRALRQAIYEFIRVQTNTKVANHLALGTRSPPDDVWDVDRALCALEHSVDLLMLTSPVNGSDAWARFQAGEFQHNPKFHYRLLPVDPDLLKRRLFAIEIDRIDDPALADLFEDKRQELDTEFTMLRERGAKSFRYNSMRLYGEVNDRLRETAESILADVPRARRWQGEWVDAEAFRAAADRELDYYRERHPAIRNTIEVRRDVSGLLVSEGNLMIGERLSLRPDRVMPLIHHEVGTHVLTFVNGSAQPLEQLALGLAGYDELQEGLAVLAEYLVGGLDRSRMRLLAARVLAALSVQEGADFVGTFRLLTRDLGYSAAGAWDIAFRVHASGGFTRDLIYLRGLARLLELIASGADLEALYVGKIAQKHLPIIDELRHREVLRRPPLTPRFLTRPESLERLEHVRRGITLTEMICPERR
ncbi:MAG: tyrosine/phenylalanine carboxypeptidase domain-containing protein [Gemmatimonadota bacterium]